MPTQLNNVSVMVNGNPAFIYFTCSAVTDPDCPLDQINILMPPEAISGSVPVQLMTGATQSNAYMTQAAALSPTFFAFVSAANGKSYVYGRHTTDGSLIGPPGLFATAPNLTTPVQPGETIYVAVTGFGPTNVPIVPGSPTQGGTVPLPAPVVMIGTTQVQATDPQLISPGTYQINIVVPTDLPNGDVALTATYQGVSTQPNLFINIQH